MTPKPRPAPSARTLARVKEVKGMLALLKTHRNDIRPSHVLPCRLEKCVGCELYRRLTRLLRALEKL